MRFAVEQGGFDVHADIGGEGLRNRQVPLVDFRQPGVNDLLVQFFLLLELKHLPSLGG